MGLPIIEIPLLKILPEAVFSLLHKTIALSNFPVFNCNFISFNKLTSCLAAFFIDK